MMIVKIKGGLGNQMFQYAFSYAASKKSKNILKLDISTFKHYKLRRYELDKYHVFSEVASIEEISKIKYESESLLKGIFRKILRKNIKYSKFYYKEIKKEYDIFNKGYLYYDGYWQSEKHFKEYRKELLKIFTLKRIIHSETKKYKQEIESVESVSLHIRRGDYITNKHTNSIHGTCSLEYYRKAVLEIENELNDTHFYIFSDDIEWAKENISFIKNITFVKLNENIIDHEEMLLMSLCKHNIIANSSFSWWGAWLNKNLNKIIIAPNEWFVDSSIDTSELIPESWVRL